MSQTRRGFFHALGAAGAGAPAIAASQRRPNVLFLIVDQWSGVASDGSGSNPLLRTPAIDSLAAGGVLFRNAYSGYPLCSPARATLFTGRMPHEHRMVSNAPPSPEPIVPTTMPTLGELFHEAGYETGYFGKEHTGGAAYRGFDEFGSLRFPGAGYLAEGSVLDSVFARDAIQFIRQPRNRPFFATVSLINPHDICYPTTRDSRIPGHSVMDAINVFRGDKYLRGLELPPLPPNLDPVPPASMKQVPPILQPWGEKEWRRYLAVYYLLIENTDWLIGQVLEALRKAGLEGETLILLTADHGDMMGAHHLVQKEAFYEEAARVPFIVSWKGVVPRGRSDGQTLVSGTDVLPTLCDYAGIKTPEEISGKSLKPVITNPRAPWRDFVVSEAHNGRMVRSARHKYMVYERDGKKLEFLYDLTNDPGETRNIAEDPAASAALKENRERYASWAQSTGGGIETSLDYFNRFFQRK